jgi:AraC-like DNA-binding protein
MEEKSVCSIAGTIDPRVERAIELVRADPRRSRTDLAQAVGLSPSHLGHLIKTQATTTLREIKIAARMTEAVRLVERSTLSTKEISGQLGYSHPSSFVRAFKRHLGEAPMVWRQAHKMVTVSRFR